VGAFGEKLRKQREQRGIELDTISNTTKISTRMLRALEEEHFDQLPGGVFNKGFVRAYARQVGLDEAEAVSDYLAALRESQVQSQNILPDFRKPVDVASPEPAPLNLTNQDQKIGEGEDKSLRRIGLPGRDLKHENLSGIGGSNDTLKADRRKQDRRNKNRYRPDRSNQDRSNHNRSHTNQNVETPDGSSSQIFTPRTPVEIYPESTYKGSPGIPWGKLAAALLAVSAVLAFWNLRRQSHLAGSPTSATSSSQTSPVVSPEVAPTPPPAISQAPSSMEGLPPNLAKNSGAGRVQTSPSQATSAANLPAGTGSASASPEGGSKLTTAPAATEIASTKSAMSAASPTASSANTPPLKANAHSSTAKPPSMFTLLVRAEKTTRVTIVADGKTVAQENLIAPAQTSVRASREIMVTVGNAAGISFLLNGKAVPSKGIEGEPRTYTFDPSGMKASVVPTPNTAR
jgi:hypothetical protein